MAVTMAVHIRPGQGHAMSKQQVLRLLCFCSPNLASQKCSTMRKMRRLCCSDIYVRLPQPFPKPDAMHSNSGVGTYAPDYFERVGVHAEQVLVTSVSLGPSFSLFSFAAREHMSDD